MLIIILASVAALALVARLMLLTRQNDIIEARYPDHQLSHRGLARLRPETPARLRAARLAIDAVLVGVLLAPLVYELLR